MRAPKFWYNPKYSFSSLLLTPISWIYGLVRKKIQRDRAPWKAPIPVICVGNLLAGGQGKTPIALSIGKVLKLNNKSVHFISRGYGGSLRGPLLVDPRVNTASEVGDEPILLSEIAPTWICVDRIAGIKLAYEMGAKIVVMDDGFQNPSVKKDFSILAFDADVGFGNGRLIPAGPLRESITDGLSRANAAVIIGDDFLGLESRLLNISNSLPQKQIKVYKAKIAPTTNFQSINKQKVFAFTGIGRPEKFLNTLIEMNCDITGKQYFSDHHQFTETEISQLLNLAKTKDSTLITTTKDYVRLTPSQKKDIMVLPITLEWNNKNALNNILKNFI